MFGARPVADEELQVLAKLDEEPEPSVDVGPEERDVVETLIGERQEHGDLPDGLVGRRERDIGLALRDAFRRLDGARRQVTVLDRVANRARVRRALSHERPDVVWLEERRRRAA